MPKADGKTIQQRFNERYKVDRKTGCWNWTGCLNGKGYAYIWIPVNRPGARYPTDGSTVQAYKIGWLLANGKDWSELAGLELHHKCENTKCVNPKHLELLTVRQHRRIGTSVVALNAQKTQCKRGHAYTKENTISLPGGRRWCRTCNNADRRKYYKKNRIKILAQLKLQRERK